MSAYLKYGCIHPRTLLADLAEADAGEAGRRYADELAWREFYADVLWHRPDSAREYLQPELQAMGYDSGPDAERSWRPGRRAGPASPSSTPGCASSGARRSCTTGCA